ncbi:MAG: hypothetical protein IT445_20210 [Phycisphaeraceae bacterium]|nr:hypothetical protein [Phycisphaeraceae bacterium]
MSWFLFKKSSPRRGRKRRTPASGATAGWDPQRTLFGIKLMVAAGVLVGTIAGWRWLEQSLADYATQTRSQPVRVVLARAPQHLSDSVAQHLAGIVSNTVDPDPMEQRSLTTAANKLALDPWVEHVWQVRRSGEGRVIVEAAYRRPVALIQSQRGYYVVDVEGVWLPTDDPSHMSLPLITGVSGDAPRTWGQAWSGQDAAAALKLSVILASEPYADRIRAIDASGRDAMGRVKLVLYTDRGWTEWGLAPGSEKMIEPNTEVKLSRLRLLAQSTGSIDADGRGVYLNRPQIMTARAEH